MLSYEASQDQSAPPRAEAWMLEQKELCVPWERCALHLLTRGSGLCTTAAQGSSGCSRMWSSLRRDWYPTLFSPKWQWKAVMHSQSEAVFKRSHFLHSVCTFYSKINMAAPEPSSRGLRGLVLDIQLPQWSLPTVLTTLWLLVTVNNSCVSLFVLKW